MKSIWKTLAFCGAAVMALNPSSVQASDWEYEATIYLFTPETKTAITSPAGRLEGTLSFSDALSNLDMAFMGAFGASNGTWSVLADYMLTDLSFGNDTPGPAFSGLNTTMKTQIFNGYVAYRVYDTPTVQLDLAGGFRWFDTETVLTLTPGLSPGRTSRAHENWIDPVVGLRARFDLSDRWTATAFFDYGGFSSDSESYQVLLTADYALNDAWVLRGGYRYISVDHTMDNGNDFEFSQSGPIFGATFRF
ncbi:porin family protein [Falsiphaeobacter marinintestinus]|uniref:porin family protein n=1 Tax=Falsiphaeobacter marinintestinus TaxID=1492905 RepID=UPI0011B5A46D|nr:porin family protein [Phaeobacter marinintestinus]